MKFSQKWLQEYIVETLPLSDEIADVLNAKAFEVESIEKIEEDIIYDIKVLPNRAHDALSHKYMALELCSCLDLTFKPLELTSPISNTDVQMVKLQVNDTKLCSRFMSVRIDDVKVTASPEWLRAKLESIGQKSINNIVDITNYVQYTINKPMHAYDASNIDGVLQTRFAKESEVLVTLDDKELMLDPQTLVIADDNKALGLAGIKGGKYSGIQANTTSIILESANFEPVLVRKTSMKYNLRTDASKRFENGIADTLVADGLYMTVREIVKLFPNAKVSAVSEIRSVETEEQIVTVTLSEINSLLGSQMSMALVEKILDRLNFKYKKDSNETFVISIPDVRLDLRIREDLIEEIGRIYGFENLVPTLPDLKNRKAKINKMLYVQNIIRNILNQRGFTEVQTYSLSNKGNIRLLKSASDKNRIRTNISDGLKESLTKNLYNMPLLSSSDVRIYEMGAVFDLIDNQIIENVNLCICIDDGKKKSNFDNLINEIMLEISTQLSVSDIKLISDESKPKVIELCLTELLDRVADNFDNVYIDNLSSNIKYKTFSLMPFVVRDIALWCSTDTRADEIKELIATYAGELCVSINIFDEFTKEINGELKKSLAYRLVYQDIYRTLTDEEVNEYADNVYKELENKGFQIR